MSLSTTSPSALKAILWAGFVAGTLDALAAVVVLGKMKAIPVFKYIASGFFGREAFTGGIDMVGYGVLFHYLIALAFTLVYFFIFPYLPFLRKEKIASGLLYGICVWVIMNFVVLPLSNVPPTPFTWQNVLVGILLLMFLVGLPISWIIHRYYRLNRGSFVRPFRF
ncbi:DUF1440 domain-containing protein [Tellurirhabdus bombi]|uniref:DUF1440 domain-containing protein n=1 Tax=Tellurirhabdus bombi TaxID=2907205 RepID=UPI001F2329DA|nr:DUF1440 domain-containing protein [Tellurirhabdus bombi]